MQITLETTVEKYAESLSRLIDTLKTAQAELRTLRADQVQLDKKLGEVGRVISFQPQTDEADHALAMLAWVMRSANETLHLGDAAFVGTNEALPHLEVRLRTVVDLINSLRAATTAPQAQPLGQTG